LKTVLLFVITAIAEIVGCYLPYLWLAKGASAWLLLPAAISLGLFAWLLTLHPAAAGRVYAAYGGGCTSRLRWPGYGALTVFAPAPGISLALPLVSPEWR